MLVKKSTQSNKYETACYVQEAPIECGLASYKDDPRGFKQFRSVNGHAYVEFDATVQTFGCYNRMRRRYDPVNYCAVVDKDERIAELKRKNDWRGELNHPNPDIAGERLTDIRMTIPEPTRCSHILRKNRLEGDRYKAIITTDPGCACGQQVAEEIIDLGMVPSFSVRLLGTMIPNAGYNQPNMRVTKVITYDMVDYPSHEGADGDVAPIIHQESVIPEKTSECVIFLKNLAQYCSEQSEDMRAICESFEISVDELMGIQNESIVVEQADGCKMRIPLRGEVRREALDILMNRGLK
jgi:hypothetical protein